MAKTRTPIPRPAASRPDQPTHQAYTELQQAYDRFNHELFDGQLRPCLITLQRKGARVMGYFSPTRFEQVDGIARTDEIAMNPMHFKHKGVIEVLQTLAHEMCHLWQAQLGTPSRRAYHNKQWAAKMIAIGLMPSDTGKPGGNTVGQHMADYPIPDGPFLAASKRLLAEGFKITWYDRAADALYAPKPPEDPAAEGDDTDEAAPAPPASGKRVKFTCPACRANAWGKAQLKLVCGDCQTPFQRKAR